MEHDFGGTSRFEIVRRIGVGGMGVVYEAIDREHQTRVALKTLRTWTADAFLRFKTEFRALQHLQHPNLVGLGELFEDEGRWFFTMELVHGESFLSWVCAPGPSRGGAPPRELVLDDDGSTVGLALARAAKQAARRARAAGPIADEQRLRDALGQLAQGLCALHRAQRVHRDIKPANILVTPDGRVKILDFGLVIDPTHSHWPDEQLVGTALYMAPEQAQSLAVGPEADWYAVGVILYQALTGTLPFAGPQVIERKQEVEAPPPRSLRPSVPADLDALCAELLRREPGARPTGRDVLRRLGLDDAPEVIAPPVDTFIGRGRELDVLCDAFFASLKGTVTILVHGESGVGKSTLVERFVERVRPAFGAVALVGKCDERESVPYKAVDGVIDMICRRLTALPAAEVAARLPPEVGLLGQMFPVMRRIEAIANAPRRDDAHDHDAQDLRRRVFATLRELLARLAAREPVVLVIEDLQWADADSLALLAEVLRPPGAPPLLVVATLRASLEGETGVRTVPELAALLPGDVRQLAIESLSPEDARALVDALATGAAGGAAAPSIDRERIAREAAGHPMFIAELVRSAALGEAHAARLEDALWHRIAQLDEDARDLLELVTIGGGPIVQETAARALATPIGPFTQQVARLRAAHLVKTGGARLSDWVEPYHDRVRNAVLLNLPAGARQRWHERLAAALEAQTRTDPEALATHWRGAGDAAKAALYAARAAEDAEGALAFDRAARLYRMALELRGDLASGERDARPGAPRTGEQPRLDPSRSFESPRLDAGAADRVEVLRLSTRLGDALTNAGRGPEAAAAYLTAAAHAGPDDALDLRRRAADRYLQSGHIDPGLAVIRDVLHSIGLELSSTPRRALIGLLPRRAQVRLRGLGFRRRAAADVPPELLRRIDLCWSIAAGLGLVDNARGSYFQTRGLLFALEAGEPMRVARALAAEAAFSSSEGGKSHARSMRLLAEAARIAREVDHPYVLAWATGAAGVVAGLEGRWADALDRCSAGIELFREHCLGVSWELAIMSWFSLMSLAYLGKLDELAARARAQLADAEARGDLHAEIGCSTGVIVMHWLAADEPDLAARRGDAVLARWSNKTFHNQHWWNVLGQAQIDLYKDDPASGLARITAAFPDLRASLLLMVQLTRTEALQLRARCALATARTTTGAERRRLLATAESDARAIAREHQPWSDPLAVLLDAGLAATRGDEPRARALLDLAIPALDANHLALYAACARARAAALTPGPAGLALAAEAADWFAAQHVRKPDRMIAMLVPGFPDP